MKLIPMSKEEYLKTVPLSNRRDAIAFVVGCRMQKAFIESKWSKLPVDDYDELVSIGGGLRFTELIEEPYRQKYISERYKRLKLVIKKHGLEIL